jgi:predicted MPP superfamily phosphohydrolase
MPPVAVYGATALALVGHGFVWTGLINRMHALNWPRVVIKSLTWLCVTAFAAIVAAAIVRMVHAQSGPAMFFDARDAVAAYAWLCAAIGAASLVVKPWVERRRYDPAALAAWTSEVRDVAQAVGRRPMDGVVAKTFDLIPRNEALQLSVDRKRLVVPRLPAELSGLSIAHLSDLHMCGRVGREFFEFAARVVNDLRPDVIAITGDIVEAEACWPWLAESVGRLCAPLGVFYILGNHDLFVDEDRTRALLGDAGLTNLGGRALRAEWNGMAVLLVGNEAPWLPAAPRPEPRSPQSPAGEFRLALCHTPDQFGWCVAADVDLVLAGHTHGGQVQLPLLGAIASPSLHGTRYACGVFRRGATVMHVTRGLGGQTPLRWRCPPEIALLELRGSALESPA